MTGTETNLSALTAADLMTPSPVTLREYDSLRQAAEELFRAGVHGAPVVNNAGECTGVFSLSDLARWAVKESQPPSMKVKTCTFQEKYRAVRGVETTLCTLPPGACSFQVSKALSDGKMAQACREPSCLGSDWQMVELEMLPPENVRHYMTSGPVTAEVTTSMVELARAMTDSCVTRVIVTDQARRPVGVVSSADLIAAFAEMEPRPFPA